MIAFQMKILKYNPSGSYTVEYIPENKKCTPIKLDISLGTDATTPDRALALLKNSSPQEFWANEIGLENINHDALSELVNTTHKITSPSPVAMHNPVTVATGAVTQPQTIQSIVGQSTPEEVVDQAQQQRTRLKLIIQEVLQEMAEATV